MESNCDNCTGQVGGAICPKRLSFPNFLPLTKLPIISVSRFQPYINWFKIRYYQVSKWGNIGDLDGLPFRIGLMSKKKAEWKIQGGKL